MRSKSFVKPLLISVITLSLFVSMVPTSYAAPTNQTPVIERVAGNNRFQTASAIAEKSHPESVQNVIIASGLSFPDALTGSVLAIQKNAPILLVDKTVEGSSDALDYIEKHLDKKGTVYILGAEGVISEDFENKLKDLGYNNLTRLGGADRYETAQTITEEINVPSGTPVAIAYGQNFPDALSISSFAANKGWPILLVNQELPDAMVDYLTKTQPRTVYLAGGTGVISDEIKSQIQTLVPNAQIERFGGSNRYETASLINNYFSPNPSHIYLSSGENFPDALAGSVLAGKKGDPLVLVDPEGKHIPTSVDSYLRVKQSGNRFNVTSLGGVGVVPDHLVKESIQGVTVLSQILPSTTTKKKYTLSSVTSEPGTMNIKASVASTTQLVLILLQKDGQEEVIEAKPSNGQVNKNVFARLGPGNYTVTVLESETPSRVGAKYSQGTPFTITYTGVDGGFNNRVVNNSILDFDVPTYQDTKWVWFNIISDKGLMTDYIVPVSNGKISKRLYLRFGSGNYTVQVFETNDPNQMYFNTGPRFVITNTDTRDLRYITPSQVVLSDAPEIKELAQNITAGLRTDMEKSKALHDWVASNLVFQDPMNPSAYNAVTILNKKLGTNKGYVYLNASLHRAIGIPTKVVDGYTLGFGNDPISWEELDQQNNKNTYLWNEVFIDGQWLSQNVMFDAVTFDADQGFLPQLSHKYFNPDPAEFEKSHRKHDESRLGVPF